MIEFTHRIMSGLSVLFAVGLVIWAWRSYPRGSQVRLGAGLVGLFTLSEAVVGAGLVLLELVANNDSALRAGSVAVHLVNTLLLVASITLTAWWASGGNPVSLGRQGINSTLLVAALALVVLLSATGAITALGDTLFPAASLAQGVQQDFSPTAHFLIRLRIYHPLLAIVTGSFCLFLALRTRDRQKEGLAGKFAAALIACVAVQICLGLLNIYLLAPIWLQMLHLLVSDLVWISLVLLAAASLRQPPPPESSPSRQPPPREAVNLPADRGWGKPGPGSDGLQPLPETQKASRVCARGAGFSWGLESTGRTLPGRVRF